MHSVFATAVAGLGLQPIVAPMLEIRPLATIAEPTNFDVLQADVVIFISAPAVEFGLPNLHDLDIANKAIFAIGSSTAAELLRSLGDRSRVVVRSPKDGFNSEALLSMADLQASVVAGQNILIVRGVGGRDYLAAELTARGAELAYLEVYERLASDQLMAKILADSGVTRPSIGVVTSVQGLQELHKRLVEENLTQLFEMPILASGARIAREVPRLGFTKPPLIADNPTQEHLIARLQRWVLEKL